MIATVCEKKSQKGGVTLWRESAYDSSGNDLRTGLYVLWLHIVYVDHTRGADSKKNLEYCRAYVERESFTCVYVCVFDFEQGSLLLNS